MAITLEQARVLDAVAQSHSLAEAAKRLRKGHTSVVYALKTLEDALGVAVLDRSGYRTRLTPSGEELLVLCRRLLDTEAQIGAMAHSLKHGWEAKLIIVYDGMLPATSFVKSAAAVRDAAKLIRVSLYSDYLSGVEERFHQANADLMVTLLPPSQAFASIIKLPKLKSMLVARRDHPLVAKGRALNREDLQSETFLTVRGSDQRLSLSTISLDESSTFHLSDFVAKKSAILQGVGYGWMPEYLIHKELDKGQLKILKWQGQSVHEFSPLLCGRGESAAGPAASLFIESLTGATWV